MSILLIPSTSHGNGSGHLARCFMLARQFQAVNSSETVHILILSDSVSASAVSSWNIDTISLAFPVESSELKLIPAIPPGQRYRLVILDRRASTQSEYARWSAYGPVLAIDEGGAARSAAAYLLDLLPQLGPGNRSIEGPNLFQPAFLPLPETRRQPDVITNEARSVLVSFGGEDKAGMGVKFLSAIFDNKLLAPDAITLVSGALADYPAQHFPGIKRVGHVQNLREHLHKHDIVVTHFGLTAYEAAWAGCAVLVLDPSRIHCRLSRKAGFFSIGCRSVISSRLRYALQNIAEVQSRSFKIAPPQKLNMAAFLNNLEPRLATSCPICSSSNRSSVYRTERKSYFCCLDCGMVYMSYFGHRKNPYTESAYFFEEYKAQYGRTYLEDLPKLRTMAAARLQHIERLLDRPAAGALVLDVGCAYGAFVLEAQSRQWNAVGSDVSAAAVAYVQKSCNVPALVADFALPAADGLYPRELDCLTMWYVIEHFDEMARVLRRAASLIRPGGIFAFSTPSLHGISGRRNHRQFLEKSPDDHFTVWDPRTVRQILARFGFSVKKIVITGHHPERFRGIPANPKSLRYRLGMISSRLFGLGDTFECYAVRTQKVSATLNKDT
ncbi:MAG: methyltransferase domain-containing protein [Spirochaetes bacterium]|nr:methyltransferase domain-containing protein [Spirochaetota bacterium]MBU0957057.1 methyltransferase domain-containing protein [Spirochaetota bacterium]